MGFDGRIGLNDLPGHGCKEHNSVLDDNDDVCDGRIDNQAAMLGGGGQIHIIDSDVGSSDGLELLSVEVFVGWKWAITVSLQHIWVRSNLHFNSSTIDPTFQICASSMTTSLAMKRSTRGREI